MTYTCRICQTTMLTTEEVQDHRKNFPEHSSEIVGTATPPEPIFVENMEKF